jgi:hypothetical protein
LTETSRPFKISDLGSLECSITETPPCPVVTRVPSLRGSQHLRLEKNREPQLITPEISCFLSLLQLRFSKGLLSRCPGSAYFTMVTHLQLVGKTNHIL